MSVPIIPPTGTSASAAFLGGALLMLWSAVPWVLVFLITQLFGVRLYTIKDKDIALRVQKRLTYSSHITDDGKGYGISIGRWYYASVSVERSNSGDTFDIWMISTTASYLALTHETVVSGPVSSDKSTDAPVVRKGLTVFNRFGSFSSVWFRKRTVALVEPVARPDQANILDAICAHQTKRGHTVVFLHGPPGSGKSMVGIMLAQRLGASYCNTLKPWQPGDTLADLYAEAEPTAETPLVVAFDEFDGALMAINQGIPPHKAIPISVADKAGWNKFMDEIDRGMFPHLLLVLTSNRDPAFIRSLDPSYIRTGRVDLIFALPVAATA